MNAIDAHQHFWHPSRGDYGWMPDNDPVLTRPYHPADLSAALDATGVTRTVLVQAAPSVAESEYLLGIADVTPFVAAVVGWVDFERGDNLALLRRLAEHPKFVGVRPMIQDLADDRWMLRNDLQWAYEAIIDLDLTFDALGFPRHIEYFQTLLMRYPEMRVVLDHCLKPQLRAHSEDNFNRWADGIAGLADETGAYCKLSGLVTEADTDCSDDALRPYTNHVLEVFGPARVIWGSDWPVARLRLEYDAWYQQARRLTDRLGEVDQARIFSANAADFYRLPI